MKNLVKELEYQFYKMVKTGKLFKSQKSGQDCWDLWLKSFYPTDNPIFRDPESSTENCNCCKNFMRRYGNIVAIDSDNKLMTLWDNFSTFPSEYQNPANMLSMALNCFPIENVFFETYDSLNKLLYEKCNKTLSSFKLGFGSSIKQYSKQEAEKFGVVQVDEIRTFYHMNLSVPKQFVKMDDCSIEAIQASYRDAKNVFSRGLTEISIDTLELVIDLINQDFLLNGKTHLYKVQEFLELAKNYQNVPDQYRDNWCWKNSYELLIAKFKNELIGVLCSELSKGMDINEACLNWNKRADPVNYMKTSAPITKRQIEEAKKFVEENGYEPSFNRRHATIDDIKASEIKFMNINNDVLKGVSIFDSVVPSKTPSNKFNFDNIKEVTIEKFMSDVLPKCNSVEIFLTDKMEKNLVSLTTSNDENCKKIFKWNNPYSWTYKGNLAGVSQIKEAVKSAGGSVSGDVRFSITWNEDGRSIVDFDLHAEGPFKEHICYHQNCQSKNQKCSINGGLLDVDMIDPQTLGVENIFYSSKSQMCDGVYKFYVHNFNSKVNTGFKVELDIEGEIFQYEVNRNVQSYVKIADVTKKGNTFTIEHHIKPINPSFIQKNIYGLNSNEFHKVNLVCLSPNHWGKDNVGDLHYFFMLENCNCPDKIRSFHNENLIPELLTHHKRVMDVLAHSLQIEPSINQLSGVGFNATVRDDMIVRLKGNQIIKIKF